MAEQPFTMAESAAALHELFLSLMSAGFTEKQALIILGHMLAGAKGE